MTKPTVVPIWDSTAVNITTPAGEQTVGWTPGQSPPAQVFNWFQHHTYKWISYIDTLVSETLTWTVRQLITASTSLPALTVTNSGAGTAITATGGIQVDTVAAGSVGSTSINTSTVVGSNAGKSATFTNTDTGSTAAAVDVNHPGHLALRVDGDVNVIDGWFSATHGVTCLSGSVTAHTSLNGASVSVSGAVAGASVAVTGAVTGASVAATGAVTGASVGATGAVSAVNGVFSGSTTRGPLNLGHIGVADKPNPAVTGDTFIVVGTTTTELWHCDAAPNFWSHVSLTRTY